MLLLSAPGEWNPRQSLTLREIWQVGRGSNVCSCLDPSPGCSNPPLPFSPSLLVSPSLPLPVSPSPLSIPFPLLLGAPLLSITSTGTPSPHERLLHHSEEATKCWRRLHFRACDFQHAAYLSIGQYPGTSWITSSCV